MNMLSDAHVQNVVASLEAAASVIESELRIINVDLSHAEDCVRKYGEVFAAPAGYLRALRDEKKSKYRSIIAELEGLLSQVRTSAILLEKLNQACGGIPVRSAVEVVKF